MSQLNVHVEKGMCKDTAQWAFRRFFRYPDTVLHEKIPWSDLPQRKSVTAHLIPYFPKSRKSLFSFVPCSPSHITSHYPHTTFSKMAIDLPYTHSTDVFLRAHKYNPYNGETFPEQLSDFPSGSTIRITHNGLSVMEEIRISAADLPNPPTTPLEPSSTSTANARGSFPTIPPTTFANFDPMSYTNVTLPPIGWPSHAQYSDSNATLPPLSWVVPVPEGDSDMQHLVDGVDTEGVHWVHLLPKPGDWVDVKRIEGGYENITMSRDTVFVPRGHLLTAGRNDEDEEDEGDEEEEGHQSEVTRIDESQIEEEGEVH